MAQNSSRPRPAASSSNFPLWRWIRRTATFLLHKETLFLWLFVAASLYVLRFFSQRWAPFQTVGLLLAGWLSVAFFSQVVKNSSIGNLRGVAFFSLLDVGHYLALPLLRLIFAASFWAGLLFAYNYFFLNLTPWELMRFGPLPVPVNLVLLAILFFTLPMTLILAAIHEALFPLLNPLLALQTISKGFKDYLLLILALTSLLILHGHLRLLSPASPTLQFLSLWFHLVLPITAFFLMGQWVFENSEALGYSTLAPAHSRLEKTPPARPVKAKMPLAEQLVNSQRLAQTGHASDAKKILRELHHQYPEDLRPLKQLFEIAANSRDVSNLNLSATRLLENALQEGNGAEAHHLYRRIVSLGEITKILRFPPKLLFQLGQTFQQARYFDEAIHCFQTLYHLNPNPALRENILERIKQAERLRV